MGNRHRDGYPWVTGQPQTALLRLPSPDQGGWQSVLPAPPSMAIPKRHFMILCLLSGLGTSTLTNSPPAKRHAHLSGVHRVMVRTGEVPIILPVAQTCQRLNHRFGSGVGDQLPGLCKAGEGRTIGDLAVERPNGIYAHHGVEFTVQQFDCVF